MGTQPENTHGIQTQTQPIPKIWFGSGYYPWVPEFWVPNPRPSLGFVLIADAFGRKNCNYFISFLGLYKFDGEVIEPIPLNAEELLRTSFKFADNTVMTGGKESRVYGIEVKTGKIRYECTMAGCFSPTGEALSSQETDLEDVIIVSFV